MVVKKGILIVLFIFVTYSECKSYLEDLAITFKEKEILKEFKDRVSSQLPEEYMKKDVYLIRWLRAKYFNIQEAEKMLLNSIQWRKENEMDKIHSEDWSDFKDKYKYSLKQRTIDGKPTLYGNVGQWDFRKAAISGDSKRFLRYLDKIIDEGANLVREESDKYQNVSQGMVLINLKGFNFIEHACTQCVALIVRIILQYENHQPGLADKMLLVNAPIIAGTLVRIAKQTFHPMTNKILHVYGLDRSVWGKILSIDYKLDQLPIELGGTLVLDSSSDYNDYSS